ncbi:hypothetical protein [Haloferula sp. BvORR071]|uniref:hypothetical protein n=1 Tax=Haloferula sp. BvORR071 TaxID=1396141 RepID=UPI00054E9073|nr:hypothetical protein [Haloferula sp. BvORR071]
MKLAPDFFQPGETLAAAKLNTLVSAVRGHRPYKGIDASGENRLYPPFEPISVDYSDEKWRLILQPSYIVSGTASQEIFFGDHALSTYPEIEVEEDKHLFLTNGILSWQDEGHAGLLVIEVKKPDEEEGEGTETRTFLNRHPSLVFDTAPALHASVVTVGDEQKISISPGYVVSQNIGDDEPVKLHVPSMEGTAIDANPSPMAAAPYIYLYVQTDHKGKVTGTPEIQGSSSTQDSTHHEPNEETSGEYYFLLAETTTEEGRVKITKRITGNRYLPNQLVEIKNVGAEREIYKGYLKGDDKHEFRCLKQITGRGEALIKPLSEETEPDDLPDTIDFRRICEKEEDTQIHVELKDDQGLIEIKGNGYNGGVSDASKVSISVQDGLVTNVSASAPPDLEGVHANIEVWLSAYDSEGKLSEADYGLLARLYFRNGRLIRLERQTGTDEIDYGDEIDDTGIASEDIAHVKVNRNFVYGESDPFS